MLKQLLQNFFVWRKYDKKDIIVTDSLGSLKKIFIFLTKIITFLVEIAKL